MFIFGLIVGAVITYFFMSPSAAKAAKDEIKSVINEHKEINKTQK